MSLDWVFKEISDLINSPSKESHDDPNYLLLRNPEADHILDELFHKTFLPKIEKAFHNSAFKMYRDDNFPRLENKTSNRLAKEFTIIIDDPDRPILPGEVNRTWFCRCELELFADHYMFKRKLCIYLPEDYDITKILRLLRHPYFVGAPPHLSNDDKSYSIQFEKGTGHDLGFGADEEAATGVMKTLIKIQKILKFLNENEFDMDTEKTYMKLENMLVSCFDNW